MRLCSVFLIIGEKKQTETTMRNHYMATRKGKMETLSNGDKGGKQKELSYIVGGCVKYYLYFGKLVIFERFKCISREIRIHIKNDFYKNIHKQLRLS